ncbi:MAG: DUF1218 domain-containing protein [Ruminococcaceae bacterium]|nr:DUF1218 domain-containing protein [Oscillospiraceae bacterium]
MFRRRECARSRSSSRTASKRLAGSLLFFGVWVLFCAGEVLFFAGILRGSLL